VRAGRIEQVGGDLRLADRNPWSLGAVMVPMSLDQPHLDASDRSLLPNCIKFSVRQVENLMQFGIWPGLREATVMNRP
jgi:hypothetical protein